MGHMDKRCYETEGHLGLELLSERKSYTAGWGAAREQGPTHRSAPEPSRAAWLQSVCVCPGQESSHQLLCSSPSGNRLSSQSSGISREPKMEIALSFHSCGAWKRASLQTALLSLFSVFRGQCWHKGGWGCSRGAKPIALIRAERGMQGQQVGVGAPCLVPARLPALALKWAGRGQEGREEGLLTRVFWSVSWKAAASGWLCCELCPACSQLSHPQFSHLSVC